MSPEYLGREFEIVFVAFLTPSKDGMFFYPP
jgi:hypothetical protein